MGVDLKGEKKEKGIGELYGCGHVCFYESLSFLSFFFFLVSFFISAYSCLRFAVSGWCSV